MSLHAVKILGINITSDSKSKILEEIQKFVASGIWFVDKTRKIKKKTLTIVTPNPEQLVCAHHDIYFAEMLNRADVALPDGIGISYAFRFLQRDGKKRVLQTIPGIEFMENLVFWAAKERVPIALIGGRHGLAVKTLDCLSKLHIKLRKSWAVFS